MRVSGMVTDSITGEKLSFVNIYLDGKGKGLTDNKGNFSITLPVGKYKLKASSMGYTDKIIEVAPGHSTGINLRLAPGAITLQEVVVRPRKQKYSRKNNPAVLFLERLRRAGPLSDPLRNLPYYTRDRYEKMTIGIDEFDSSGQKGLGKRMKFLKNYIDTNRINSTPVLLISLKEQASKEMDRLKPHSSRRVITGSRSDGIDQAFNQENIQTFLRDIFREVDIYDNDITLLQNKFVSPLSNIAANYYKYFLTDTLNVDGERCIELSFVPHNPESFGFNGKLYVPLTGDSSIYVKRVEMRVPKAINVNFLEDMVIVQQFRKDSAGMRHKTLDDMAVTFKIMPGTPRLYARRESLFDNFSGQKPDVFAGYYDRDGATHELPEAALRDENYWARVRLDSMTQAQSRMGSMADNMRKDPLFYWTEKVLKVLVNGYVPTGNPSKVDIGPVNTLMSGNSVEGMRFRIGAMTTAYLSKRIFARGYVAYGTKDKRWKYNAELEYSFVDKKYHSREFPMHSLRLTHNYDIDWLGQHYLFTNTDNVFLSLKRMTNERATYRRLTRLQYLLETRSGFSIDAGLRHETQERTKWLPFVDGKGQVFKNYTLTSFQVQLRYSPGETFYQAASERIPINMDAPVLMLSHEYGPKGFLGSDFTINKTELSARYRFWLSAFGYIDAMLKGSKIWSSVPYPALAWANANLSYTIQPESFSLMNPMEFATDEYITWDITYWLNGFIFNRIPYFNKLKLREVMSFKGIWGHLSKRNDPELHPELYRFPENAHVGRMNAMPYMEISAGIDNILSILRVEYVWRLSYRHTPNTPRSGLRIALHFTF